MSWLPYRLAHRAVATPVLHTLSSCMMQDCALARRALRSTLRPEIGEGFFADHGVGIVIGQTAVLGEERYARTMDVTLWRCDARR